MGDKMTYTLYDRRGKATGMSINIDDLTSLNFDAVGTDISALQTALKAIAESDRDTVTTSIIDPGGGPSDQGGLRGNKALIRWYAPSEGEGGQYGSNELGCIDDSHFTEVGGRLLLQGTLYDDIKAAFDALARTENGNQVEVYEIEHVSRNL